MSPTYPCPACTTAANLETGCPGCGRPPDPEAAEVIELASVILDLTARVEQARQGYTDAVRELTAAQQRRDGLAAKVRARIAVAPPPGVPARVPVGTPAGGPVAGPARPETSGRTVQNVLFILGGLLLGSAAIVFTAVAWANFGVAGRAAILGVVTLLTLAVPPVARWRRLTATAETFAALGLLLVFLDGYAAWYVNLASVADSLAPASYAGIVCGVTAAVAVGYGIATHLTGPRFVALAVAQPVLPLLVADAGLGAAGWAGIFAALAAADLAVAQLRPGRPSHEPEAAPREAEAALPQPSPHDAEAALPQRAQHLAEAALPRRAQHLAEAALPQRAQHHAEAAVPQRAAREAGWTLPGAAAPLRLAAWTVSGLALLLAVGHALLGLLTADTLGPAARAGGALVAVAAVFLAATVTAGVPAAGGGVAVLAVLAAGARVTQVGWPNQAFALVAAEIMALAVVVAAIPARVRTGPRIGVLSAAGLLGTVAAGWALVNGIVTAAAAQPAWHATLRDTATGVDWRLPAALALLALAVTVSLPRTALAPTAVAAGVLAAFAVPAAVPLAWWAPSIVDGVMLVPLAVAAVRSRPGWRTAVYGGAAGLLATHAVVAGLGRPASTAGVLTALVLLAGGVAVAGRGRGHVGAVAAGVTVLALPALAAAVTAVAATDPVLPRRYALGGLVAAALLVAALGRRRPGYAPWAGGAVVLGGTGVLVAAITAGSEPYGVYAAVIIGCELAVLRRLPIAAVVTVVPALAAGVAVAPALAGVLLYPYRWVGLIWTGAPRDADVIELHGPYAFGPATVALALITAALILVRRPRAAAVPAAAALLTGAVALGAPWPGAAHAQPRPRGGRRPGRFAAVAVTGARHDHRARRRRRARGDPGHPRDHGEWARRDTGRGRRVRVGRARAGGPVRRLDRQRRQRGLPGAGRPAGRRRGVAVGGAVRTGRGSGRAGNERRPRPCRPRTESGLVEVAAHATAVAALMLASGSLRHAAAVCTLWGAAIGLRALWPVDRPRIYAAIGCELLAYWLILVAGQVTLLEAYTVPGAGVALLVGWLVARARPETHSWAAYGVALLAGFGPSALTLLNGPGSPTRRLLLGLAGLIVVVPPAPCAAGRPRSSSAARYSPSSPCTRRLCCGTCCPAGSRSPSAACCWSASR